MVAEFRDPAGLPVTKLQDEWLNNTTVKVLVQNVQVLGTIPPPRHGTQQAEANSGGAADSRRS